VWPPYRVELSLNLLALTLGAAFAAGYLLCGTGVANCEGHLRWPLTDRGPHLLETVRPGVFAAGDVRADASKRVAGAVGDGALVVRLAYEVLAG